MAVELVMTIKRWIGLSADTKPTPTAQQAGSTFYETNTGVRFIWNATEWVEDISLIYALTQALGE